MSDMITVAEQTNSNHSVRGYCALCTAHCATIATVENGRIVALEADPDLRRVAVGDLLEGLEDLTHQLDERALGVHHRPLDRLKLLRDLQAGLCRPGRAAAS